MDGPLLANANRVFVQHVSLKTRFFDLNVGTASFHYFVSRARFFTKSWPSAVVRTRFFSRLSRKTDANSARKMYIWLIWLQFSAWSSQARFHCFLLLALRFLITSHNLNSSFLVEFWFSNRLRALTVDFGPSPNVIFCTIKRPICRPHPIFINFYTFLIFWGILYFFGCR